MEKTGTGVSKGATLLASAPSKEALEKLVAEFYCGPKQLILHDDGKIETGRGICSTRWEARNGRYRFFMPPAEGKQQ